MQRRTSFVLGSRSLGADDWKVRRFASGALFDTLLNFDSSEAISFSKGRW